MLNCGANGQLPGFGLPDSQGNWTGLDVDLCRAIAAAVLGDANKVKFVALTAKDREDLALSCGYAAVIGFVEPFYVAAGFAMYLNRRAALEAWDIEQEFRRAFGG